jgi:hypothetical protein
MAKRPTIDVRVEVMDSEFMTSFVKLTKARVIDMALGGALMGCGATGLMRMLGLSYLWVELPLLGIILYRNRVSTKRLKQEMRAEGSALEMRMETED